MGVTPWVGALTSLLSVCQYSSPLFCQVVELMKRQPAVPETGTLVPAAFSGKITLQASMGW